MTPKISNLFEVFFLFACAAYNRLAGRPGSNCRAEARACKWKWSYAHSRPYIECILLYRVIFDVFFYYEKHNLFFDFLFFCSHVTTHEKNVQMAGWTYLGYLL